uniref:Leucine rich repeat containing 40 n=1 Tax=Cyprinus carpio carpio TaxID=630221 RepID=A0A9J8DHT0_CYPCA
MCSFLAKQSAVWTWHITQAKVFDFGGQSTEDNPQDLLTKGTGELLKYLRSRKQEQPDGSLKEEPKTATTLPSQAKINVHAIKTLKTQDYRLKKIIISNCESRILCL